MESELSMEAWERLAEAARLAAERCRALGEDPDREEPRLIVVARDEAPESVVRRS